MIFLSSLLWMPRCWPSVRESSTASSTASASFSSRRSCSWDRTWRLRPEPSGPSEPPESQKVRQQHLNRSSNNSSSSSSTSQQGSTPWRENPLPHRVTSAPWAVALWTTNCPTEFLWITRRWWAACRGSSALTWTRLCSRACSSSLEGRVSPRTRWSHQLWSQMKCETTAHSVKWKGEKCNWMPKNNLVTVFFFLALVQQDPPFPPEMSPTSPLLSPQNSTSQSPLLQQAPPPGYQSPDMKSWQQTGIASNRWDWLKR